MYTDRVCRDLFQCYPSSSRVLYRPNTLTGSARHAVSASRTFSTRLPLLPHQRSRVHHVEPCPAQHFISCPYRQLTACANGATRSGRVRHDGPPCPIGVAAMLAPPMRSSSMSALRTRTVPVRTQHLHRQQYEYNAPYRAMMSMAASSGTRPIACMPLTTCRTPRIASCIRIHCSDSAHAWRWC